MKPELTAPNQNLTSDWPYRNGTVPRNYFSTITPAPLRTAELAAIATGLLLAFAAAGKILLYDGPASWASYAGLVILVMLALGYPAAIRYLPPRSGTRIWVYFLVILSGYMAIGLVMRHTAPATFESALYATDLLFSLDVYRLAGDGVSPWLAEIFGLGYLFYYPYGIGRSYAILKRLDDKTERFFLAIILAYCVGFAGYLLCPALGPRYAEAGTFPPSGPFLSPLAVALVDRLGSPLAVMPSMHVAATALVFFFDLKHNRAWALACAAPVLALWTATMGLGFHYGIDALAGLAIAGTCLWAGHRFPVWFSGRPLSTTYQQRG